MNSDNPMIVNIDWFKRIKLIKRNQIEIWFDNEWIILNELNN